ncbi:hypothetical protein [Alteromonas ponticola]|uniref:Uncharacterized protein n=1 Tax=Alteromonas ponticola TaxID=2720613 RepID=A0ABX1R3I4_9ALTE|nr:hypothetical protein [Alteromonas ponticola]NMH61005.1 hypothetical protein [Alteromonas ponticola]
MKNDDVLDVLALARKVKRVSEGGALPTEWLREEQILYGMNHDFPNDLQRITPDYRISIGKFKESQFHSLFSLLHKFVR